MRKTKFPIRNFGQNCLCIGHVRRRRRFMIIIIITDCIQTKLLEFVGQKQREKKLAIQSDLDTLIIESLVLKIQNGKMMQLKRFPIHFAYMCIFTFAIFLCIHPADTPITGRNHCLHWNVKNVICDRLQEQESTPWIFKSKCGMKKKFPFQMILMVEYDTYIFYVSIQRQIIICVFCRSF